MSSSDATLPKGLRADIDACGYFPDLIADAIALSLAGEPVVDHLVHHEATFSREEIQRHLSVLVLTPPASSSGTPTSRRRPASPTRR